MKLHGITAAFLLFIAGFTSGHCAPPDSNAGSIYSSLRGGDLVSLQGKNLHRFDETQLANTRYFAIYYSASWCGPCRAFTPELVKFYDGIKPNNPQFELIFVSRDESPVAMENYMKADQMNWPALAFTKLRTHKTLGRYAGNGIPCLVLVDSQGVVLSHSYVNKTYVGPSKVMDDIQKILAANPPTPAELASAKAAAQPTPGSPSGSNFDELFKKRTPTAPR